MNKIEEIMEKLREEVRAQKLETLIFIRDPLKKEALFMAEGVSNVTFIHMIKDICTHFLEKDDLYQRFHVLNIISTEIAKLFTFPEGETNAKPN